MGTDLTEVEIRSFIDSLTPEEKQEYLRAAIEAVRAAGGVRDNPDGFGLFYKIIQGNDLPAHGWAWIEHIYQSRKRKKGSLIFTWRGSWKTTTISVTFTAWRIGIDPIRANLIIQANDDSADDTTHQIADIIKNNPGWKAFFPNIVPDEAKGWGAGGYEVKDNSITYGEWRKKNSHRKDPTLLGLGVRSKTLIGKHPDGVLLMDDIHDEENTTSDKELRSVINKVTGTILPFEVEDENGDIITWTLAVGTPWRDDDAYHYLKATEEYEFFALPLISPAAPDAEGDDIIDYDGSEFTDLAGRWRLNWADRLTWKVVMRRRRVSGLREFHRMYRLDLQAAKVTGLKYQSYPAEAISYEWIIRAGVDFASIKTRMKNISADKDFFAMLWAAKIPTGGVVIMDGRLGHYTTSASLDLVNQVQNSFKNFQYTVIEEDGKGEEFVNLINLMPHLRIQPLMTKGRKKLLRQETMSPWLENGIVRISDADTPALNALRKALDDYPDGNDDIRDALYWVLRAFPEELVMPDQEEDLDQHGITAMKNRKKANPIFALAKM